MAVGAGVVVGINVGVKSGLAFSHAQRNRSSLEAEDQRAFGLSRRPSLDPESGMIFEFDSLQTPEHGFWMWRTRVPLDIAYIESDGTIGKIVSMGLCGDRAESCPSYPAGVEFAMALEANLGWFAAHGIAEGDRVSVLR